MRNNDCFLTDKVLLQHLSHNVLYVCIAQNDKTTIKECLGKVWVAVPSTPTCQKYPDGSNSSTLIRDISPSSDHRETKYS